jgi:hypothetical protein
MKDIVPPGVNTRENSARAAFGSRTCSNTSSQQTASTVAFSSGKRAASATRSGAAAYKPFPVGGKSSLISWASGEHCVSTQRSAQPTSGAFPFSAPIAATNFFSVATTADGGAFGEPIGPRCVCSSSATLECPTCRTKKCAGKVPCAHGTDPDMWATAQHTAQIEQSGQTPGWHALHRAPASLSPGNPLNHQLRQREQQ